LIVVTNASPLNYLILLGHSSVLPVLYSDIWIPVTVVKELSDPRAPEVVRSWMKAPPSWLSIEGSTVPVIDEMPARLNAGEVAAISLALHRRIPLILLDERDARDEATRRGLVVAGTLRVLADASLAGLLSLPDAFRRLQQTNFRAAPALYDKLLAEVRGQEPRSIR
jgi:predicted nucleic acid-binding protein